MAAIAVRPAAVPDVYALARTLRAGDRAEIQALGKDPRRSIRFAFRHSLYPPQACFVDDEIAAMWGLGGMILGDVGEPWLLTSLAAEKIPVSFIKIARGWIADALAVKPRLENYVMADYAKAVRLLEVLGFSIETPVPAGPKGVMFRKFWIEVA